MTWTTTTSPFDGSLAEVNGLAWADDLAEFLAVGQGASDEVILRSPNGIAWTAVSSPFARSSFGIANGVVRSVALGLWVVVGDDGEEVNTIITSPDHVTWTGRGNPFSAFDGNWATCVAVKPSTGALIAGGETFGSDDAIATSPDAITWTPRTCPVNGVVNAIAYSTTHDRWIAVGTNGSGAYTAAYSDNDGATWTAISPKPFPSPEALNGVYYDSTIDRWFIMGGDDSGATVAYSDDNGATWTMVMAPVDSEAFAAIRAGANLGLGGTGTDELALSTDDGATWIADATATPFSDQATCFAYSSSLGRAVVGGETHSGPSLAYGLPSISAPIVTSPEELKNTWRWVVCDLGGEVKSFLDRLATGVSAKYILDDSAEMDCDLASDDGEIHQLTSIDAKNPAGGPRVDFGNRLLYGLRREEPADGPPWVCRFAGLITILQDQATEDEPVTHLTANDPWTWLKSIPVLNPDGSLLGQGGLTYSGKTGDYIAKDLISNAYAWIVATFANPLPWSGLPNDGDHNFIDISSGHFDTTAVIDQINFAQGCSVGEAWTQLCATGTVDIILEPIFDQTRPGIVSIMNVYSQAGSSQYGAVFGWDLFPRNLVAVDDLRDGTQIENWAQFFAANLAATHASDTDSIDAYGPYFVQKNYPAPADAASVGLLALAEVALRKKGKRTIQINPTPELSPDPFTQYYLGDTVPVWAGRPLPPSTVVSVGDTEYGNALRGGVRSSTPDTHRVYGFEVDLADDLQETIVNLLLSDPNA